MKVCFRRTDGGVVLNEVLSLSGEVIAYHNLGCLLDEEMSHAIATYGQKPDVLVLNTAPELAVNA